MHWVGVLEVVGPSNDTRPIWAGDFPVRLEVRPLLLLDAQNGVPMRELEGKVAFYETAQDAGKFKGIVRSSPNRIPQRADGELLETLLHEAQRNPTVRPVDKRKLYKAERKVGQTVVQDLVSVPETDEVPNALSPTPAPAQAPAEDTATTRHTEIQYHLLTLGADMGLDVWVARNDRSRTWNGHTLGELPHMVNHLPTQFNEATQKTIELIDVLWLKGNSIVAAFEVECTTSVYSGLLRMSDLLALQPNLDLKLYLVAPDERRTKVAQEIRRPTFQLRSKPLHAVCGFLAFSNLVEKVEAIRRLNIASSLSPSFLEQTAEYFNQ
ncbi:hypothetical protein [Deinococcus pimensis]|uniref:hypothetical protein n=1 Tax=Deinococcus pimensis TaxID=309888 RepID=UPI00146FC23D|nr:hypothetical protein [Deinococcus pimensis]